MTKPLALVLSLAMSLPLAAHAAPPGGGQPVVVTAQPPSGTVLVVQEQPAAVLVPQAPPQRLPGNYDRMAKALRIERIGVLAATAGLALELAGLIVWASDSSDDGLFSTNHSLFGIGYAVTLAGLVTGSASGLVASNQLYRFGVPNHHRGLAITSLVFAFWPFAHVVGYILNLVHLRRTQAVANTLQRVSLGASPMLSMTPGNVVVGGRLTLAF